MFLLLQVFLKKIFYELSDAENLDYGLEERWRVSGWLKATRAVVKEELIITTQSRRTQPG